MEPRIPCRVIGPLVLFALLAPPLPAADSVLSPEDRALLTRAGVKAEPASVLNLLRKRNALLNDPAQLRAAIERLADRKFTVRERAQEELASAGPAVLPLLKEAFKSGDSEQARRARQSADRIEELGGGYLTEALARVLAIHRPVGATEAILGYLPFSEDIGAQEALLCALTAVATSAGKVNEAVLRASRDPCPARRAAAAFVLGWATDTRQRRALVDLAADTHPEVRWQAASALARASDPAAFPTLIALLTDAPLLTAWRVERLLRRLARNKAPQAGLYMGDPSRRTCRAAWEAWWKVEGAKADFRRLNGEEPRVLFLTVVPLEGCVVAFGTENKERWRVCDCGGPIDAEMLPSGRVLLAENHSQRVTERELDGRIVWQYETEALPAASWRLCTGNTVIATTKDVFEITPAGKKVWVINVPAGIWDARKLRSGGIVVLSRAQEIISYNPDRSVRFRIQLTGGLWKWTALTVLSNGNYAIPRHASRLSREISPNGETVRDWETAQATSLDRLPNGHLLICSETEKRVLQLDREGKLVHEYRFQWHPWRVRCVSLP
jgi:HEAT repeats